MSMDLKCLTAAFALLIGAISLSAEATLKTAAAREKLKAGAVVVDVRTPEEFKSKSLPGVINVPLDSIQTGITNSVTNKTQVILLHCRSGRRSGIAEKELRALGYTNAFNIGSYEQAQKIVDGISH